MAISESAKAYYDKMFPGCVPELLATDPEFVERFQNFAFDEVVNEPHAQLDDKTRFLAILSTLMGCQGIDEYRKMLPAALHLGLTPVEIKEMVYEGVAYLGMGRAFPFLKVTNEILTERGVQLPLEPQATATAQTRLELGSKAQMEVFGDHLEGFWQSGPEDRRHINRWVVDNCFGDYYTRTGLDVRQRELVAFCMISAQGGCDPQLITHAAGSIRVGNDPAFLVAVVSACLPYIGYPRSLNALRCVRKAAEQK